MALIEVETISLFPRLRRGLIDLLENLEASEWEKPTVCKGWNVKDVALHLLGVEVGNISRHRDGTRTAPPAETELANWLNDLNQEWVIATRRMSPPLLRDLLDSTGRMFESHLETLDLQSVTAHVSWASPDPVPVWLDVAREFTERWVHQQQIRDATHRHGLDGPEFIEPVLRTFIHALPMTYEYVEAPEGSTVQLKIEGPGGGTWYVTRSESHWKLEAGEHDRPNSVITMDTDSAWRLFTRDPRANPPVIEGDTTLGGHIRRAVAIIA